MYMEHQVCKKSVLCKMISHLLLQQEKWWDTDCLYVVVSQVNRQVYLAVIVFCETPASCSWGNDCIMWIITCHLFIHGAYSKLLLENLLYDNVLAVGDYRVRQVRRHSTLQCFYNISFHYHHCASGKPGRHTPIKLAISNWISSNCYICGTKKS